MKDLTTEQKEKINEWMQELEEAISYEDLESLDLDLKNFREDVSDIINENYKEEII